MIDPAKLNQATRALLRLADVSDERIRSSNAGELTLLACRCHDTSLSIFRILYAAHIDLLRANEYPPTPIIHCALDPDPGWVRRPMQLHNGDWSASIDGISTRQVSPLEAFPDARPVFIGDNWWWVTV